MSETPRATECPEDGCHALIPAIAETRANHKAGHTSDKKARRALENELREIRELLAQVKEDNRTFRREITNLDIPAPTDPLVIEAWPEDELTDDDDVTDGDIEDDPRSTYLDDITPPATVVDPTAGEPDEDAADADDYPPAIDRDEPATVTPTTVAAKTPNPYNLYSA